MILVLSGTRDGRYIVERLLRKGHRVISTTATEYGGKLFDNHENLKVISKKLNQDTMEEILLDYKVEMVIDATHPYAVEVSKNIINAAKSTDIEYIRYERKAGNYEQYESVKLFDDFKEASSWLKHRDGKVLLTTGSNNLKNFLDGVNIESLYIRVLPTVSVVKKCEELGFLPKQIIAIQGPFSKELNKAMYKQYGIKYLVTKDSGDIGGTKEKIETAIELGLQVLLIKRPKLNYDKAINNIDKVIEYIQKHKGEEK